MEEGKAERVVEKKESHVEQDKVEKMKKNGMGKEETKCKREKMEKGMGRRQ